MSYLFTTLIVLLPILAIYRSPVPGTDLATFLMACFFVFAVWKVKTTEYLPKTFLVLVLYIVLITLLNVAFEYDLNAPAFLVCLRLIKFIFVPCVAFLLCGTYFNYQFALKLLRFVSLAAVSYITVQTLFYKQFGILLPNAAMSLILQGDYENIDYEYAAQQFLRPTSFFLEPAHFAQYIIVYLIYSLFREDAKEKPYIKSALYCSFGIVLSTSGQGMGCMVGCWVLYFFRSFGIRYVAWHERFVKGAVLFFAFIAIYYLLADNAIIEYVLERLLTDQHGGNAVAARTMSYVLVPELSFWVRFYGVGFGNPLPEIYYNSLSYFLYCTGYIGTALAFFFFVASYSKAKSYQKVLCLVIGIFCFVGTLFTAIGISFYFMFIRWRAANNDVSSNDEK